MKVQEIRELIKLIDQSSINEFTYESDGATVTMKKFGGEQVVHKEVVQAVPQEPAAVVKPTPVVEEAVKEEPNKDNAAQVKEGSQDTVTDYDYEITSPMVGTFYSASSPESDPYVAKGSNIENDSVVCIVEAMKLFNEIEAEVKGEIVEILVENGELVEYGQPLFRVKKK